MDDRHEREALTHRVAEHRKLLGDWDSLDPRVRTLAQSGSRNLLPPRPGGRNSSVSLVVLAVVAAIALIGCVATATAVVASGVWLQGALNDPTTTVQGFYGAVKQQNFQRAYSYFSASARSHMSEATFTDTFGSYDRIDGAVSGFTITRTDMAASGSKATVIVSVERKGGAASQQVHTLLLVKEDGVWRINSLSIALASVTPTLPRK